MIGDAERDVEAGHAAGCRTVLVENPDSGGRRPGRWTPDARAITLRSAIGAILGNAS
jgi:phosphoglycolate phosphatase-like HAD superfamily hydrolase